MGPYDQGDVKKKCLKQWKVRELVLLQKENCNDAKNPMENCPKVQEPLIAHLLLLKRHFKTIKCLAMDTTQSLVACHPSSVALILLHCQSSPITHVLTLCFLLLNPLPTNLPCASIAFPIQ